jgi:non-specific protein-tyrosine kinase
MLGVAATYLLDRLDKRIKRVEDVERAYGFDLVGVIPHATLSVHGYFREAFRTLLTNIQCTNLERAPRTILVTSALPGEGKSTIVRNLALAARDSGLRVAVVESDLRHPSLATIFRVQETPGLIDVLSDGVHLRDALQTVSADVAVAAERQSGTLTAAQSNGDSPLGRHGSISVLTSGSLTTNPPAVLLTERVGSLFDQIAAEYDVTLIDSSPLLTVSDAVPLLSRAEATVLVCRVGLATVPAVRRVDAILARHPKSQVLGVVANDVPAKEFERRFATYYGTAAATTGPN